MIYSVCPLNTSSTKGLEFRGEGLLRNFHENIRCLAIKIKWQLHVGRDPSDHFKLKMYLLHVEDIEGWHMIHS